MNAYSIPGIRSQGGYRVGQFKQETFFIDPEYIIKKVSDHFKVDIFTMTKNHTVSLPRQIAVYLIWIHSNNARGETIESFMQGSIKRSNCIHAYNKIKTKCEKIDSKTKRIVDEIIRSL